jgi:hypothetical protein
MDGPPQDLIKATLSGYIAHWTYVEHGRATIAIARYHDYKGEKTFRQFTNDSGSWKEGLPNDPYPLFGLNSLSWTSALDAIFICEGERKADLLHQLGWPAVSSMLGARNTTKTDFSPLKYFSRFIILRDNDSPGIDFAVAVSTILKRMNSNNQIWICNLSPDKPGEDIVDWVIKFPMYGSCWNGFDKIGLKNIERVSTALESKIQKEMVLLEEFKSIPYKSTLTFFSKEPKPLIQKLRPVKVFPELSLEKNVRDYLMTLARQKSLSIDLPATVFLNLIGGVIGRRIQLKMMPNQNWIESANVWTALIAPPSFKKSPSLRELFKHINQLEEIAEKEYKEAHSAWNANQNKVKSDEPILKRYVTDDCTTAKLKELFLANPGGLILRNDELKGMLKKLDTVGYESDRGFFLQSWSGLDYFNEDRIGRGSNLKIPLTLTWIGCIPPNSLTTYLNQAIIEGFGSDGLMQRFQMPCYPDFEIPFSLTNDVVSEEMQRKIDWLFHQIDLEAARSNRILIFSSEAQKEFNEWLIKSENDARFGGHLSYWESHLGKMPKLLASLCIILHRTKEVLTHGIIQEVSLCTLYQVFELIEYYKSHAQRCYESIESLEMTTARKILNLIKNRKLDEVFKASEIYGNGLGGLTNSNLVRSALNLLQELDWMVIDRTHQPNGGRPSENWIVHPKVHEKGLF